VAVDHSYGKQALILKSIVVTELIYSRRIKLNGAKRVGL
jgi:hypothetical protein